MIIYWPKKESVEPSKRLIDAIIILFARRRRKKTETKPNVDGWARKRARKIMMTKRTEK